MCCNACLIRFIFVAEPSPQTRGSNIIRHVDLERVELEHLCNASTIPADAIPVIQRRRLSDDCPSTGLLFLGKIPLDLELLERVQRWGCEVGEQEL